MKRFAIAVDGPAGSGKSTVAKMVAKRLGIIYVDTGAMYRTVALFCTEKGIALADEAAVVAALADLQMKIVPEEGGQRMVELQQEMAREHSVIMDGRDIGTVVLPDAEVKIYLDAGVEERARRRVGELQEKGETADFEEIKKMILERDYNDMHRAHSPLKRAADAVSLDSTGMGIDAVLHAILDIVAERVKEK